MSIEISIVALGCKTTIHVHKRLQVEVITCIQGGKNKSVISIFNYSLITNAAKSALN